MDYECIQYLILGIIDILLGYLITQPIFMHYAVIIVWLVNIK